MYLAFIYLYLFIYVFKIIVISGSFGQWICGKSTRAVPNVTGCLSRGKSDRNLRETRYGADSMGRVGCGNVSTLRLMKPEADPGLVSMPYLWGWEGYGMRIRISVSEDYPDCARS